MTEKQETNKQQEAPKTKLSDLRKTPNEMSAETPAETNERYGVDQSVTKTDHENPRVEFSEDDFMTQVPSGTHLHPDIAKDLQNRGISAPTTDVAQVRKGDTFVGYDFADEPVAEDVEDVEKDKK